GAHSFLFPPSLGSPHWRERYASSKGWVRMPVTSLQACCDERPERRRELGFDKRSLAMQTGLAEHGRTCLPTLPLSRPAVVLVGFPHQVSRCPQGLVLTTLPPFKRNLTCAETAHPRPARCSSTASTRPAPPPDRRAAHRQPLELGDATRLSRGDPRRELLP